MNNKEHILTVVLALFAGLVGGVVSSQIFMGKLVYAEKKEPKVIEANEFRLVDNDGRNAGSLGMVDGLPALVLWDKNGVVRATFGLGPRWTPWLVLTDKNARPRAVLGLATDGAQRLALHDENDVRAVLGSTELKLTKTGSTEIRAPSF